MALGYFTDSTPLTPLRDPFNVLVDEINDNAAIVSNQHQNYDFRWADAAARTTQAGMRAGDTGYQIDTATDYIYTGSAWRVNTGGLVLIGRTNFSAATSVPIDGVFTSAFSDYKVVIRLARSTTSSITFGLRAASSTISAANYGYQQHFGATSSSTAAAGSGQTSWTGIMGSSSTDFLFEGIFSSPQLAAPTMVIGQNSALTAFVQNINLYYNANTAADGFILTPTAGNITGRATVFGLVG